MTELTRKVYGRIKENIFPKIKPPLPVAKKNLKKQLITNPEDLKDLFVDTFKYRLRHRPVQPGYEELLELQEELFNLRLKLAKEERSPDWTMNDLNMALRNLKSGKCRDQVGLVREIFQKDIIGDDLKKSMLMMYNKIKKTGIIPTFMRCVNISAVVTDLDSDRGFVIFSIF